MVTIGVDPHKQTHTAAAANSLGVEVAHRTAPARPAGNGQLLEWARTLDTERVWAIEDVRKRLRLAGTVLMTAARPSCASHRT